MSKRKFQRNNTDDDDAVPPDPPISLSELARLRTEQLLLQQQRNDMLRQAQELLASHLLSAVVQPAAQSTQQETMNVDHPETSPT